MSQTENYWQTLTSSSNMHFEKGDFKNALSGYEDALCRAEVLNNHISDCIRLQIPFIQVYIISCNNLANTYEVLGKHEDTESMLKRSVYYLLHLAKNNMLNMDEIHAETEEKCVELCKFCRQNKSR
ncbi:hypothetical protein ACFX5U_15315 [Sphingobacterium sp. SG20118]|uniref:hypothetical protein n=1 Tax=Sphingobacterium sp. SG20118 TaxID=3367156 RepID=UPI0037DFBF3C